MDWLLLELDLSLSRECCMQKCMKDFVATDFQMEMIWFESSREDHDFWEGNEKERKVEVVVLVLTTKEGGNERFVHVEVEGTVLIMW
mgnify:CR=1 FL=1